MSATPDIVIIGSGMGGATLAAGLARSGARIAILERGDRLPDVPETRDARAIFVDGYFRPKEMWLDRQGKPFNPGNYYYVGGNSKFYGAVLIRYRERDFDGIEHAGGQAPAWPFRYGELEPWYARAEELFRVRGEAGEDPLEPPRSTPYPHPPVPDEPAIAALRERLRGIGLKPFSLPLAVDLDRWLEGGATPWDAYPNTGRGKLDAESAALAVALKFENVSLVTNAMVERLIPAPDGRRIAAIEYVKGGELRRVTPAIVVLAAGAVNSAAILLRSAGGPCPNGIANRSDAVGRYFMQHNSTALVAIDPRWRNDSVYQKTLALHDYYFDDGEGGPPLGNVQLVGKVSGPVFKAALPYVPGFALDWLASHSVTWGAFSEDLPDPESRVRVNGRTIISDWRKTNLAAHQRLIAKMKERFRAAGFPLVLSRAWDQRTPSHQCGTVRMGADAANAPLDIWCRAHDHENLFVVDASFLPTSAAVNPALTIAAQALRVADHMIRTEFHA
ncbi:MAG: GMC family oxidoreductase [Rhizobiales bacterium]|nr:GMC family oxidoreductase [Hyphomicrobiales bacterium]